jgi:hypothetical protein
MTNNVLPHIDDGFDAGDDNAVQRAMLANLEQEYQDQVAAGDADIAQDTLADITALKVQMAADEKADPNDEHPDMSRPEETV